MRYSRRTHDVLLAGVLLAGLLLVAAAPCFADDQPPRPAAESNLAAIKAAVASNLASVKAAMDPDALPPLAKPVFPTRHPYDELGPPGGYFPERAQRLGQGGVAIIQCRLADDGSLSDCVALADCLRRLEMSRWAPDRNVTRG